MSQKSAMHAQSLIFIHQKNIILHNSIKCSYRDLIIEDCFFFFCIFSQHLNELETTRESPEFTAATRRENIPKNRSQAIIPCNIIIHVMCSYIQQIDCDECLLLSCFHPGDKFRVHLQPMLDSADSADYINASYLDVSLYN